MEGELNFFLAIFDYVLGVFPNQMCFSLKLSISRPNPNNLSTHPIHSSGKYDFIVIVFIICIFDDVLFCRGSWIVSYLLPIACWHPHCFANTGKSGVDIHKEWVIDLVIP